MNSGNLNYNHDIFTPNTGKDNVFDKNSGIALDIETLGISNLLKFLLTNQTQVYVSINQLIPDITKPFTLNDIALNMKPKSVFFTDVFTNNPISIFKITPKDSGILVMIRTANSQGYAFFFTNSCAFLCFQIEQSNVGWTNIIMPNANTFPIYATTQTPAIPNTTNDIHMIWNQNIVHIVGILNFKSPLPSTRNFNIFRYYPIQLRPIKNLSLCKEIASTSATYKIKIDIGEAISITNLSSEDIPANTDFGIDFSYECSARYVPAPTPATT